MIQPLNLSWVIAESLWDWIHKEQITHRHKLYEMPEKVQSDYLDQANYLIKTVQYYSQVKEREG